MVWYSIYTVVDVDTLNQVGGWTHPLIPGASPVLEAANGAFMFPDVYADGDPGAAVGIVVSDEVPQDVRSEREREREWNLDNFPNI